MNVMKEIRKKPSVLGIPGYAIAPFAIDLAAEALVYWGIMLINAGRPHHGVGLVLDELIPANGWWVIVYFGVYFFWLFGFIAVAREGKETCFRAVAGDLISKAICMAFFLIMPTANTRPDVSGPGVGNAMLRFLYSLDKPENLFPSIHCYWTWFLCRWLARNKSRSRVKIVLCYVFAFMVFYSTLATKQHYFLDVPGGVAAAELGLYLEKKLSAGKMFRRLDEKLLKA